MPPVTTERIATLDVIRGVAVMGIFSVNVIAFAMIEGAYFNPGAYGGHKGADLWLWAINLVLIDGKMRSLFSMLFGASMLLVIDRAEARGENEAAVHARRMLVLLLFGFAHFYLLWFGDILTSYAVLGLAAFFFRQRTAPQLFALGCALIALNMLMFAGLTGYLVDLDRAAHAAGARAEDIEAWNGFGSIFYPSPQDVANDLKVHSTYLGRLRQMVTERATEPLLGLTVFGPETLGLMLLGMAGLKSGFLTGTWSNRAYRRVALWGLTVGAAAFTLLAIVDVQSRFFVPVLMGGFFAAAAPFRVLMALGYGALIILMSRSMGPLAQRFAAAGRCAFSNYLGASIIAGLIFYGWGFGLYGQLSRWQAWTVAVPLVWMLMLLWSKPWLARFHYGPFEWAWRSLSRGEWQRMHKALPQPAPGA